MYVSAAAKQKAAGGCNQEGASPRHGRGDNRKRERSLSGLQVIILKDKDQRNSLLIKARGGSGQRQTEPKMAEKVRADRCKGCNMASLPCLWCATVTLVALIQYPAFTDWFR